MKKKKEIVVHVKKKLTVEDIKIETEAFSCSPKEYKQMEDDWYNKNVEMYKTYSREVAEVLLTFFRNSPDTPLNNKYLAFLERQDKKAKDTFNASGHLRDNMLNNNTQLALFKELRESTKNIIENDNIEINEIAEGIQLTASEHRMIHSLSKMLHTKSQIKDPQKDSFYAGNLPPEKITYNEGNETILPRLAFTLYEITQEYKGDKEVNGKDVENVKTILINLSKKKFLIRYSEKITTPKGLWTKMEYEGFRNLIHIDSATLTLGKKDIIYSKNTKIIIALHPIFKSQIHTKFIKFPSDTNKRITLAYGNHKVPKSVMLLYDYLLRAKSSKIYTVEIGFTTLYNTICGSSMKQKRKSRAKKDTDIAINTMIHLKLLESFKIADCKTSSDSKFIFKINKNWI